MRRFSWTCLLFALSALFLNTGECRQLAEFLEQRLGDRLPEDVPINKQFHWAVLVAGSKWFWNYRHQSDVCHAYQLLKEDGMPDERIIVMVYDDIAESRWNPYPGQVFNVPGGKDVYPGCAKDYTGEDVTTENFLAVLRGDKKAMKGIGSGRVVKPHKKNRVFLFYDDHGSTGIVGMPSKGYLYGIDLVDTLQKMHDNRDYKEMVVYIESCEAGSMFEGILPEDIAVYGLTAANAVESSWATFCPDWGADMDQLVDDGLEGDAEKSVVIPNATYIGTCLGDLFSVAYMLDTATHKLDVETLHEQFKNVEYLTSNGYTYRYGSHVMQYGDTDIDLEVVGDFLSILNVPVAESQPDRSREELRQILQSHMPKGHTVVDQRDADLVFLMGKAMYSNDMEHANEALAHFSNALTERRATEQRIKSVVESLVQGSESIASNALFGRAMEMSALTETLINDHATHKPGHAAVHDWDCLKGMVSGWEAACGRLSDHTIKYGRTFANLCNIGVTVEEFMGAVSSTCGQEGSVKHKDLGYELIGKRDGIVTIS